MIGWGGWVTDCLACAGTLQVTLAMCCSLTTWINTTVGNVGKINSSLGFDCYRKPLFTVIHVSHWRQNMYVLLYLCMQFDHALCSVNRCKNMRTCQQTCLTEYKANYVMFTFVASKSHNVKSMGLSENLWAGPAWGTPLRIFSGPHIIAEVNLEAQNLCGICARQVNRCHFDIRYPVNIIRTWLITVDLGSGETKCSCIW